VAKSAVAVCLPQIPFFPTGTSLFAKRLKDEIKTSGRDADIVALPLNWHSEEELINHSFAWRLIEMEEANGRPIDRLVCLDWPSFFPKHKHKTLWLLSPLNWAWQTSGLQISPTALDAWQKMQSSALRECKRKFTSLVIEEKGFEKLLPPARLTPQKSNRKGGFVLCASSLRKQNRVAELLTALAEGRSQKRVVITGTGPEEKQLKKMSAELKLTMQVELTGFIPDAELQKLFEQADALYAGNDYTLSIPEGECAGLPLISPGANLAKHLDEPPSVAAPPSRPTWQKIIATLA
jgi:hypothetical protein